MKRFNDWTPRPGFLPGLSIQQPWSWMITHGIKSLENRDWTTKYRGPLVIHAGQKLDPNAFYESDQKFGAYPVGLDDLSFLDMVPLRSEFIKGVNLGGIVGICELVDVVTRGYLTEDNPWFVGKFGFVLRNIKPCKFREYKGELGLFSIPEHLIEVDESESRYQRPAQRKGQLSLFAEE